VPQATATSSDPALFADRRDRFLHRLGGAAAVIPAAPLVTHHADVEHPFRQNSDFWYLTGFDEPGAVALFLPHKPENPFVLFVAPKEASAEVWNGFRWGCEGAVERFGADLAHPIAELAELLPGYLDGAEGIAFRVGRHPAVEPLVLKAWGSQLDRAPRSGSAALGLVAPCPLLHELRLRKSPEELARMREAARISAEAHELARQVARPGLNERQVQAVIEQHFLEQGARGTAYGSIVAGGDNACVLHYLENDQECRAGDLVLVDVGASYANYCADLTRTYPVSGRFTPRQRAVYEAVLRVLESSIARCVPGMKLREWKRAAQVEMAGELVGLGLITAEEAAKDTADEPACKKYFMHGLGHSLGLGVHDIAPPDGPLEPGWVMTVEPGIYIPEEGLAVRLENDVLVTEQGPVDLCAHVPIQPDEIESLLARRA